MIFCARATRGLRRPSPGLMARLGVPVGGRVRKLRAVGDQSGHPPRRETSKLGRTIVFVQRMARCPPCSQNAHDQNVLDWDKSASWRDRGWAGDHVARGRGQPWPLPLREVGRSWKALAWANGTSWRADGWAGEEAARSGRSIRPAYLFQRRASYCVASSEVVLLR